MSTIAYNGYSVVASPSTSKSTKSMHFLGDVQPRFGPISTHLHSWLLAGGLTGAGGENRCRRVVNQHIVHSDTVDRGPIRIQRNHVHKRPDRPRQNAGTRIHKDASKGVRIRILRCRVGIGIEHNLYAFGVRTHNSARHGSQCACQHRCAIGIGSWRIMEDQPGRNVIRRGGRSGSRHASSELR